MASSTRHAAIGLGLGVGVGLLMREVRRRREYSYRDKVVVITGGSRGLGLLLARELANEGAHLALIARDEAELQRVEDELSARGVEVLVVQADLGSRDEVFAAVHRIVEEFTRIDVLINNAGTMQVSPLEHLTMSDFKEAMDLHAFAPLNAILAVLPHMQDEGGGRIVNIASIGGKIAFPHLIPYSMSKFALVGLSDGLRAELSRQNIQVTTVCPGLMRTGSPINVKFKGRHREEQTWFTISDSLPLLSISGPRAARRILAGTRRGAPIVFVSAPSRLAAMFAEIAPGLTARLMAAINRALPTPDPDRADESFSGRESQSRWSPSLLTRLTDRAALENNEMTGNGKRRPSAE